MYTMHAHLKYIWIIDDLYLKESIQLYPREVVPVDLNNHIPSRTRLVKASEGMSEQEGGKQPLVDYSLQMIK